MKITARAEPRYYIELTKADAEMIRDVAYKVAARTPRLGSHGGFVREAAELAEGWVTYIGLLATAETHWTRMVNATHRQLDLVTLVLAHCGPMPVEKIQRLNAMRNLFTEAMGTANRNMRQFDLTFASVELMEPL